MDYGFWFLFGLASQGIFFLRFLVQWIVSERAGKSIVPNSFWYMSVIGGLGIVIYSIHIQDLVFIIGSILGMVFYVRNVWLIKKKKVKE